LYGTTPIIISGKVPSLTSGTSVFLATGSGAVSAVNSSGLTAGSTNSFADGYYYFIEPNSVAASGSTILTYTTANNTAGGTAVANSVDLYPSSGVISGLNLTTNAVNVGDTVNTQTLSNTTLANAYLNGPSLYYTAGTSAYLNNNTSFNTTSNTSYNINGNITTTGSGAITFAAPVSMGTVINNYVTTTLGNINFNGAITGPGALFPQTTSGNINFNSTIDGVSVLEPTSTSGITTFSGLVGGTTLVGQLYTAGLVTINTSAIKTSSTQNYANAVTLGMNTTLNATGNIGFASTLDGGFSLITNATAATLFGGIVGGTTPLTSLNISGVAGIQLNGTGITTTGAQTYNNAVTLGGNETLTSNGSGGISFASTVDGPNSLSIGDSSGAIAFNGLIGGGSALSALTIGTGDITTLGSSNTQIKTSGSQTYNSALIFSTPLTVKTTGGSGNISINAPITWSNTNLLTLNSANNITLASNGLNPIINATAGGNLTLIAANQINLNGGITLTGGTLASNGNLIISASSGSAVITPAASVSGTSIGGAINVNNFNITEGQWNQVGSSLASFSVGNNFQINSGNGQNVLSQFIRASSGAGTSLSPYAITDVYGLEGIGSNSTTLGYSYVLANNIDATATSNWNSKIGFVSLGSLTGNLNGNNFAINNLYMNNTVNSNQGLFSALGSTASVTNLGLTNVNMTFNASAQIQMGIFAGLVSSGATFNNNYATGSIADTSPTLTQYVGGLVGINRTTINNSYNAATVYSNAGSNYVGGITAYNDTTGIITNSYNIGAINAFDVIGATKTGGIAGINFGSISSSYNGGAVSGIVFNGNGGLGGIAGFNQNTITNTYNIANITNLSPYTGNNGSATGGLVGNNGSGTVSNSYSSGAVIGDSATTGGLIGSNSATVSGSFWDTQTSGQSAGVANGSSSGMTGGTFSGTSGVNLSAIGTYSGWSITSSSSTTPNSSTWFIIPGSTRPILTSEEFISNTPLAISTGHQLELMNANLSASYQLAKNIDLTSGMNNAADVWGTNMAAGSGAGFVPIAVGTAAGGPATAFSGTFNGQNYTINNIYVNLPTIQYVGGLFGYINSTANNVVQNVGLTNVNVRGLASVGGITGYMAGSGTNIQLNNVYVTGAVTALGGSAGGLSANMGANTVGLFPYIVSSYNAASVTATNGPAGGILGGFLSGEILNSYNIGTITSINGNAGGLDGQSCGGCFASGEAIVNSYNSGVVSVSGSGSAGGLVGLNNGSLSVANSYWDTLASGVSTSSGGGTAGTFNGSSGVNLSLINNGSNNGAYTGWSITSSSSATPNSSTWFIVPGSTRPMLMSEEFSGNTPLTINNAHQLQLMSANLAGNYTLGSNIDFSNVTTSDIWSSKFSGTTSGTGFAPVGDSSTNFTGSFNGANYTINNLYINLPSTTAVGLFGQTGSNITVQNVGLTNVNVTGASLVGALVGQAGSSGTIYNSYSTGSVNGTGSNIGGLIGQSNTSTVTNDYSAANVSAAGASVVGGLIGGANGVVSNSYSIGNVTGSAGVGGLLGAYGAGATIFNTYSTGVVSGSSSVGGLIGAAGSGTVSNSFWDVTTSGIGSDGSTTGSAGGIGKNTANMMLASTFSGAGWSITSTPSSTSLAPSNVWFIIPGGTRPILLSEEFNSNGTAKTITTITNGHQLQLAAAALGANYTLGNNIDLTSGMTNRSDVWATNYNTSNGAGFSPIGNSTSSATKFTGTFMSTSGQEYAINNLYIKSAATTGIGLFGATSNATIADVGLTNESINITSAVSNVGGLIGTTGGSYINNTYALGNITAVAGTGALGGLIGESVSNVFGSYTNMPITISTGSGSSNSVGGLIGYQHDGSFTTQSFSLGAISITSGVAVNIGGLVGYELNSGNGVTNSFSFSPVTVTTATAGGNIAGLVGNGNGSYIANSYSTGKVFVGSGGGASQVGGVLGANFGDTISNIYWDSSTSGQSAGSGTSKTTAQLQAALPSGFSSSIWGIVAGNGTLANGSYPYLLRFYANTPRVVSGTTNAAANSTVTLASNGSNVASNNSTLGGALSYSTTQSGANGFYYFLESNGVIANGASILNYLTSGGTANAITVAPASNGSATGLSLTIGQVTVGDSNNNNFSNAMLAGATSGSLTNAGTNILYGVTGSAPTAILTLNSGTSLFTTAASTYALDGTIATSSGGTMTFNGATTLGNAATLNSGSGAITFGSTVTGSGQSLSLNSTAGSVGAVTFNGAVTLNNLITSSNAFAVALLGSGTDTISSATTFNNTSGVTLGAGNILNFTNGVTSTAGTTTVNGTVNTTNSNIALATSTISGTSALNSGSGTISFGTLTGTGNLTLTSSSPITVSNTINIGGLTFAAGGADTINTTSITTSGNQVYNNALTLGSLNTALTTTGTGSNSDITLNGVTWSGSNTLTLTSGNNIYLNGNITATSGTLNLNAVSGGGVLQSITSGNEFSTPNTSTSGAGVTATVNVGKFNLQSGDWYQNASSLPAFNATNFELNNGSGATNSVQFLRVTSGNAGSYTIGDVYGLQGIGSNSNTLSYNYTLANNIDANSGNVLTWNNGLGFTPIGQGVAGYTSTVPFTGNFDGNSHVISNLYINNPNTVGLGGGLFGDVALASGGYIRNVGLVNVNILGGSVTGGLIGSLGFSQGTISNSFVTGSLSNHYNGEGAVSLGGLIGNIYGGSPLITNVYSTASLSGSIVGGLVGYVQGGSNTSIQNTYNIGSASYGLTFGGGSYTYTNSFYDSQTSGASTGSSNGSASTASGTAGSFNGSVGVNLSSQSTYTGWDFTNTWGILPGQSYPYLKSFYSSTPAVVSGFIPGASTSGTSTGMAGTSVSLATGSGAVSAVTNSGLATGFVKSYNNGFYYFLEPNTVVASGNTILTSVANANAVDVYPSSGGISGLNLTTNAINVGDLNNTQALSNATLANAYLSGTSLYTASGNNITFTPGGNISLNVINNTSFPYLINGNLTTSGTGAITFNNAAAVATATSDTLTTASGNITFNGALNGAGTLTTTSASGTNIFTGLVGNSTALTSLITNGLTNINTTSIQTTGAQTYNNAVTLGAIAALTSTSSGDITFGSTLNGGFGLTTSTAGNTIFGGVVGGTSSLTTLTTLAGGTTKLNSTGVNTSGAQSYGNAVTLGGNEILTSTAAGGISFANTINGAKSLLITNASGAVALNGSIGSGTALSSLTIGTGDTTTLGNSATTITTSGAQSYGSALSIGTGATTFTTNSGANNDITIGNTLTWSGSNALTLSSGNNIYLNGNVTANNGTLNLSAATGSGVWQSITSGSEASPSITGVTAAINVGKFNLTQGGWYQNAASLPAFNATDFEINNGNGATSGVQFLRATSGSAGSYAINDIYGLEGIGSNVTTLGYNYTLSGPINASSTTAWNSGAGFVSIGNGSNAFTGSFDGQNNTINALYMNATANNNAGNYIALFGNATLSASNKIQNIGLTNVNITGGGSTAGLVAQLNAGTITNAYTTGTISSIGNANGSPGFGAGGLVGELIGGTIQNSYSYANLHALGSSAGQSMGGLVGFQNGGTLISNSFTAGSVSGTGSGGGFGGLVGYTGGTIQNSYSMTNVSKTAGSNNTGGFVGHDAGATISNSYSTGNVSASSNGYGFAAGGGSYTNDYWDTQTSGQANGVSGGNNGNIHAITTTALQAALPSGFTSGNGWSIIAGASYPYLNTIFTSTPSVISGFIPSGAGSATTSSNGLAGTTVNLASGATRDSTSSLNDGYYYFLEANGLIANGGTILTATANSNAIDIYPSSGGISGLNLMSNVVNIGDMSTQTLSTNTLINAYISGLSLYSIASPDITLNSGVSLNTTNTTSYLINGNITASGVGAITFNNADTVSGSRTLTTGAGNITFNSTLDGSGSLTLTSSSGATLFENLVGNATPLASLTTNGATTINTTLVKTSGGQTYNNALTLSANAALTSTSSGNINFASTLTGPTFGLTTSTAGTAIFGGITSLASLATGSSGTTQLNSTGVTTSGTQNYGNAVTIGGNENLTSTGGSGITFASTINGANSLSIANGSGAVALNGSIGLSSLTIGSGDTTTIGSGNALIQTSGSQLYNSALSLSAASTLQTTTSAGNITINAPVTWANTSLLTLSSANNITLASNGLNPIINATGGGSLTLQAANQINLNGGINLTGGTTSNANLIINNTSPSALITPAASVAGTSIGGAVNATNFNLMEGSWNQINSQAALANFAVSNNFQILSGGTSTASGNAKFIRALSGDGSSSGNAYLLTDVYGLQGIAYSTGSLTGYYTLNNDINAASTSNWNNHSGFMAIGTGTSFIGDVVNNFNGYFNGQDPITHTNHVVNGLYINQPSNSYNGLFGTIGYSGTVTNVGVVGTITGGARTGGIAGLNEGTISNSFSNSIITGTGPYDVGGLVGRSDGSISSSFSTGSLTETTEYFSVGGLVGYSGGAISNSYSTTNIIGTDNPGSGLIGGLVGENHSNISNSYATGYITTNGSNNQGGLIGSNHGPAPVNSYWDTQTSGQNNSAGGIGKTTAQLQAGLLSGFSAGTWGIIVGNGSTANGSYPYLLSLYTSTPTVVSGYTTSANTAVQLAVNGAPLTNASPGASSTFTGANGFYYFLESSAPITGNTIETYLTGATKGSAITQASSSAMTGLNITPNTITVGDNNVNSFSNTYLLQNLTQGSLGSANLLYSGSGSNLVLNSGVNFTTSANTTYTLDGTLTPSSGNLGALTFNGAVLLGTDISLNSGTSAILFNSTINSASSSLHSLSLTSSGTKTVAGVIGGIANQALSSLSMNGGGTDQINTSAITTNGAETFSDAVTLGSPTTTLTSNSGGNIQFASTVNGANALTINTAGNTIFGSTVGNATALTSLATGATGTTQLNGNVTTTNLQNYNNAITLGNSVTLTSNSGDIKINGATITGAGNSLTINNAGSNSQIGAIFSGTNSALTKNGAGTLTLNAANNYTGATTISAGTLVEGASNAIPTGSALSNSGTLDLGGYSQQLANISGNGTLTNSGAAAALTFNSSTAQTISNLLSGANLSLIDAGTGVLTLSNGSNSYGGSTTINNGATLTMSNGSVLGLSTVNVNGTLNLPSTAATINNNIVLTGTINNTSNANMNGTLTIPDNASATINVPGGNFNTFGKIYGTNLATVNKTGGSTWHLQSDSSTTYFGTMVQNASSGQFEDDVSGGFGAGTLIMNGPAAAVALGAGFVLSNSIIYNSGTFYNAGTNPVTITGNITLNNTMPILMSGNTLTVTGNISGNGGISTDSGTLILRGAGNNYAGITTVGGTLQVGATNATSANSLISLASGKILDLAGFNTIIGSLTGSGSVTLGNGTLTTDNDNTSTTFSGIISGNGGLTKMGSGTFTLGNANTYLGATTISNGTLKLGANNGISNSSDVTIASGQTFDLNNFSDVIGSLAGSGNVNLGSGTLTSGSVSNNNSTTFSGVMSGAGSFAKSGTGTLTLSNANSIGNGTTVNSGTLLLNNASALGTTASSAINVNGGGILELNSVGAFNNSSALTLNGGTLLSSGTNTIANNITLAADNSALSTANNVSDLLTVSGGITGNHSLFLQGGNGAINLANSVNTKSLTSNVNTSLSNGDVSTSGAQTYNNTVTLGANTTLTSTTNGNIALNASVNGGGNNLTANTDGVVTLGGVISNVGNLATNALNTSITGGSITTSGSQTYNGAVNLGNATTLASTGNSNISFGSTLDGANSLATITSGTTQFSGAVGSNNALTSLTTGATGNTQINGGRVATSGAQTYNNAVSLGANTTFSSSANGNIAFGSTVSGGASNVSIITGGTATFFGLANNIVNLVSSAATTNINGGGVNTTGTQTYNGLVTAANDVIFNASTILLNGGSVNTTGSQTYNAPISLGANTTLTTNTNIAINNGINSTSNNLTVNGNSGNNIFTFVGNLGANIINVNGSVNGNNALAVQSGHPETWLISSANGGSISGTGSNQFNFLNIGNLVGGNNGNNFTIGNGTLTGSINGGNGNNTLMTNNGNNNNFNISAQNSGSATGVTSFSNIQNLIGGSASNSFNFTNSGALSGSLNGGGAATNTLNYSVFAPVNITMTSDHGGTVQNIGGGFQNINNLISNSAGTLTIANGSKTNVIHIIGALQGYVNDPTNFSGFNTFMSAGGVSTQVVFDANASYNVTNNTAMVGGSNLTFGNISNFSGNITAQVNASQNAAITSAVSSSTASTTNAATTATVGGADAAMQANTQISNTVSNNLNTITDSQNQNDLQVTSDQKVTTNCS
jgi:hypothetical protein